MAAACAADESDDYHSLFQECVAMWGAAVTAPSATNLRILAKEGKLSEQDASLVLTLPVSFQTAVSVFLKNKDLLLKEFSSDKGIPFHITVLSNLHKYIPLEESEIVVFDDGNRDSELVYGIAVNRVRKRIILVFRGSVSKEDYKVDFTFWMKNVHNPVMHQGKIIKIHAGYQGYLNDKQATDGGMSKFDAILDHLKRLHQQYPDYGVYIAGHSLGGSLANLAAFQLANEPEIPSPITAVTFGALLLGDLRFRRAFQVYEAEKRIRCVGVMNKDDIIPLLPRRALVTSYCHIGTKLLISDSHCSISRDPEARCYVGALIKDVPGRLKHSMTMCNIICCKKKFWDNHSVEAYSDNLIAVESELKQLTVDEVCTHGKE